MSTPFGHSLLGGAILKGFTSRHTPTPGWLFMAAVVLIYANLPDIDLLFGAVKGNPNLVHHQWTHSLFFCLVAGMGSGLVYGAVRGINGFRPGIVLSLILLSHLLLDMLTRDSSPPYGIQLLWPVDMRYYIFPLTPLPDVYKASSNKAFFSALFSMHNLKTAAVELLACGPLLLITTIFKRRADYQ
jgi:membrane-bound metal-dependent hydrolase YbcI (DUF457 family)